MIRRILAFSLLCAAFASTHARAEEDAVQFFPTSMSPPLLLFMTRSAFLHVDLKGKATGDVVVFFGIRTYRPKLT